MAFWNKKDPDKEARNTIKEAVKEFERLSINQQDTLRQMMSGISGGYDYGDQLHNIYNDFGYPDTLNPNNFWNMYRRFGVASAVVEIPPSITWMDKPTVETDNNQFDNEFESLMKKVKGWERLKALDVRQRVMRYSGLFVRVRDGKKPSEELTGLNGIDSIVELIPLYESQLRVSTTDSDVTSERFSKPVMYNFNSSDVGDRDEKTAVAFDVHWTRIITAAEGADDGSIYGIPALESIYNDLMDLRKISGASGEGFYQNTRSAPVIQANDDRSPPSPEQKKILDEEIEKYISKWSKKLYAVGIELKYPNIQLSDPEKPANVSRSNISAGARIPSKLIFGNQQGNLASEEDMKFFMTSMNSRRENFANELILSWVDWCMSYNVLPRVNDIEIIWNDLLTLSDKEKAELGKQWADTNRLQFQAGQPAVYTSDEIRELNDLESEDFEMPSEDIDEDTED